MLNIFLVTCLLFLTHNVVSPPSLFPYFIRCPLLHARRWLFFRPSPNLTWRDMQHLSVLTSKRNQLHDEVHQWRRNGVGLEFNHLFGYGVLDAGGMVKMAKEWKTVPERFHCVAGSIQEIQWVTSPPIFSSFRLDIRHITSTQYTFYNTKMSLPRCWKENTAEHKRHTHLITGQSQYGLIQ